MTQQHTPTPYMVEPINNGETYQLTTCEDSGFIFVAETVPFSFNGKEQAEFMKRACNGYYDLVAALNLAYTCLEDCYTKSAIESDPKFETMRKIIARAKEVKS